MRSITLILAFYRIIDKSDLAIEWVGGGFEKSPFGLGDEVLSETVGLCLS
jgi:hypothetical protein